VNFFGLNENDLFKGDYINWRETRIKKIEEIFEKEFFINKSILELGCGYGHVGKYFQEILKSKVTFSEGNKSFIKHIQENNPDCEVLHLDQDKPWNLNKKFDIIIHWGVLYHLDNWKEDLLSTMNHSNLIFLESEVANSDDENYEFKLQDHDGYDQAVNTTGTRPSSNFIEKIILQNNFSFKRYDDISLNSEQHRYNWKVTNQTEIIEDYGKRRFWILERNEINTMKNTDR
jgi:SAM-dependent methyltransferase